MASQPAHPATPMTTELLQHFDQNIAARLAWVDCPSNPWRQVIIPLALKSPMVLCTLLSLSSEDLAYRYVHDHPRRRYLQDVSMRFRNNALTLLAEHMRSMRERQRLQIQYIDPNETRHALASTLVLYNVELLGAEAVKWRMHLQAGRVILQWKEQASPDAASLDEIDTFLFYEHYYSSVFAGLTTFRTVDEPSGDMLRHGDNITIFSDFVRVIHRITQIERVRFNQGSTIDPTQVEDVKHQIEEAWKRMTQLGQTFHFRSRSAQQDFTQLICIFYHASLIYGYRVLANDPSIEAQVQESRDSILQLLSCLSDKRTFAHDLTWPLFIAGTECRGLPEMQAIVSQEMETVMKISGVLDRQKVLSFLKHYWSIDLEPNATWIHLMRDKVQEGSMLIL
ncbi:hypothetical protein N7492_003024 [Penicillium capsulatum]|uniref:Uncharacterized protein n=1 Tax=Penicillium capsulatum TaxID=69766 RepID=A0A9W9LWK8_9EURO|nr:hypothetical protein N7492_003024 [Penicillium capsulatum]KAJ6122385.1 hypothetical protein N7512_004850 [Penicillium capsulatum]